VLHVFETDHLVVDSCRPMLLVGLVSVVVSLVALDVVVSHGPSLFSIHEPISSSWFPYAPPDKQHRLLL
jgi:hypothetical protein